MLTSAAFAFSSVVVSALATPLGSTLLEKRTPPACAWNSVTNVTESFTLLAVGRNDPPTLTPLALGELDAFQPGIRIIASAASLSKNYGTNFTMTDGAMYSIPVDGSGGVALSNYVPTSNTLLEFTASDDSATGDAIPAYCELFNTSPHGVTYPYTLAVNADLDDFALCTAPNNGKPVDVIVFAPDSGVTDPYDASSCVPVSVQVLHDCC
ncbi:unnamed protein product [Peniophora sp. CBMAI 1063]|nr:unnamed protein product [Peniophora sp. CBMAI 1063]